MFKSKSRSNTETTSVGSASIIGAGTTITGDIQNKADIRIDGTLKGNIYCSGKVIIGAEGMVEGDITGQHADILGTVTGRVKMTGLLHLHGKAVVEGDIHAAKLQIEATVSFNGQCHMGANVVELNPDIASAVNE